MMANSNQHLRYERRLRRMLRSFYVAFAVITMFSGVSNGESVETMALTRQTTTTKSGAPDLAQTSYSKEKLTPTPFKQSSSAFPPITSIDSKDDDAHVVVDDTDSETWFERVMQQADLQKSQQTTEKLSYHSGVLEQQPSRNLAEKRNMITDLSSVEAIRRLFGGSRSNVFHREEAQSQSSPTTSPFRFDQSTAQAPLAMNFRAGSFSGGGSSSSPSPTPIQGNGGGFHGGGFNGGGGMGSPSNGNFSNFGPNGNFTDHGGGFHGGSGGGGGHGQLNSSAPDKHGPPKFGCTDDFIQGSGGCNSANNSSMLDSHAAPTGGPYNQNGTSPEHGNMTSTAGSPFAVNDIELGVSVLVPATAATVNLMDQVIMVINEVLDENTTFHVMEKPNGQHIRIDVRKNNIWLVQDQMHSNVSLVTSSSKSNTVWQRYALGYQCFREHVPIQDEGTLQRIFAISQDAIDASVLSGSFLRELRSEFDTSLVDIQSVSIFGVEDEQSATFPASLSTSGWDVRRLVGLSLLCSTLLWALLLMHLGEKRDAKLEREAMWGIPLGTEQDVVKLLNLGFIWQQGDGQEGPPKGVVVFNKQRVGYRDDDSMLLGGFQVAHEVVDTTLPSSATSWEART